MKPLNVPDVESLGTKLTKEEKQRIVATALGMFMFQCVADLVDAANYILNDDSISRIVIEFKNVKRTLVFNVDKDGIHPEEGTKS